MAARRRQVDGRIEIVTPENIAFEYRLAGPFMRLPAYLIDVAIRLVALLVLWLVFALIGVVSGLFGMGMGAWLVAWFLLEWFYGGLFETYWNGQTPGKRLMNLRVVTLDGQPINALQAVLRNLLRGVDGMPLLDLGMISLPTFAVGLTACLLNSRYQRLGDLACGTMVVAEDRQRLIGVARVDEPEVVSLAATLPASFTASRSLARALAKYVDRRKYFAPARRAEIAAHLGRVLVEKFRLPTHTSHDLLLCALYYRTFIADRASEGAAPGESPFAPALQPARSPFSQPPFAEPQFGQTPIVVDPFVQAQPDSSR